MMAYTKVLRSTVGVFLRETKPKEWSTDLVASVRLWSMVDYEVFLVKSSQYGNAKPR